MIIPPVLLSTCRAGCPHGHKIKEQVIFLYQIYINKHRQESGDRFFTHPV